MLDPSQTKPVFGSFGMAECNEALCAKIPKASSQAQAGRSGLRESSTRLADIFRLAVYMGERLCVIAVTYATSSVTSVGNP